MENRRFPSSRKMRLKVIGKNRHQYYAVTQLMKRKDIHEMIIATDAGREGELVTLGHETCKME